GTDIKTGVIQGNVPQDVKEDSQFAQQVNDRNLAMTRSLIATEKPDIVFWSESSTLFPLRSGGDWTAAIITAARETSVPLLIGSDSYAPDGKVYNSAFLINPEGQLTHEYSKIYLVPFGEFVPFHEILFFAGKMVPEISDFSPGTSYTEFPLRGDHFALNICFEVVFPQLARRLVNGGASLLVTITNDAWFGNTSAPYQHFDMAAMRAIENRRYLVRSANTGVSGVVDPYGRMLVRTPIFQEAAFASNVKWIHDQTFYTKYGDWILYLGAVALLILLVLPRKSGA
ncbi:MAG TPA: apolipoprotein N-acyltransferase, partial [Acidobacteriota bacterium]|nr:apolipoprotein N-acyltransferase [Acidobacteriota bacterium]